MSNCLINMSMYRKRNMGIFFMIMYGHLNNTAPILLLQIFVYPIVVKYHIELRILFIEDHNEQKQL